MFERHFGLREHPFPAGHQLRFLYPSREHQEARAHLRYGIENREPFVLISGEVGTGKTTALYDALAEWGNQIQVALITNSALTRQELLEEICLRFGVQIASGVSKPHALVALERHLLAVRARGEWAVLLLDEAQNLAMDLLEEIRLLSNLESQGEKLLQIFLVGQPELEAKLSRPELRQLRQRITVHYRLNPLSPEETAGYIHHRISVAGGNAWVAFPPEACREVYRITHGIPREINTVASAAMLAAYTENAPSVRAEHVLSVAAESEFRSVLGGGAPRDDDGDEIDDDPLAPREREPAPPSRPTNVVPMTRPSPPPPPAPEPPARTPSAPGGSAAWSASRPSPPPAPSRRYNDPQGAAPPPRAPYTPPAPAPAAPAWQPQSLESPPVERVAREEIDAWSAAARELMAAHRRPDAPPASPPPTPPPPMRSPIAQAAAAAPPPSFPSREELAARPAPDPYAEPDYSHLPASIREKLRDDDDRARRRVPIVAWVIGGIVIAAIVIGALVLRRVGPPQPPAGETPSSSTQAAPTEPVATPTEAPTATSTPPATTPATARPTPEPAVPRPAPVTTTPAAAATTPVVPPAAAEPTYGIVVAQYLNEERAREERDRLTVETKLQGKLVTYRDAGVTMYRLVLGDFASLNAAETRAGQLLDNRVVDQASVVPLAPKR